MSASHEQIKSFVYTVRGAIDQAGEEDGNHGNLWKGYNADLNHLRYIAPSGIIAPPGVDTNDGPVILTARDWHGRGDHHLIFWMETPSREAHEMPAVGARYYGGEFFSASVDNDSIDEEGFKAYLESYMQAAPDITAKMGYLGVVLAFRYGMDELMDSPYALKTVTKESAEKANGTDYLADGFQLKASILQEVTKAENTATVEANLTYYFKPEEIDWFYGGALTKALLFKIQGDEIVSAERESHVSIMDTPFIDDGQPNVSSSGEAVDPNTLPDLLKRQLYKNEEIMPEDIEYFTHLLTEPLEARDIDVLQQKF